MVIAIVSRGHFCGFELLRIHDKNAVPYNAPSLHSYKFKKLLSEPVRDQKQIDRLPHFPTISFIIFTQRDMEQADKFSWSVLKVDSTVHCTMFPDSFSNGSVSSAYIYLLSTLGNRNDWNCNVEDSFGWVAKLGQIVVVGLASSLYICV